MEMRFSDSRPLVPSETSGGLRPLGWSELCARLVAAHDTRSVLEGRTISPTAGPISANSHCGITDSHGAAGFSFHESAAALLRSVELDAEALVNPASSANGNDAEGKEETGPNVAQKRRPDEIRHD